MSQKLDTEKSFPNLTESNRNQIDLDPSGRPFGSKSIGFRFDLIRFLRVG